MSQTEVQLIKDAVIVNADVSGSAAIDVSKISGAMPSAGGSFTDDVTFQGANYNLVWDKSDNALEFSDNSKLRIGDGPDLQLYHTGSHSYIREEGTGSLRILGDDIQISNQSDTEGLASFTANGAVQLYYDGSVKFATTSTGVAVTGQVTIPDGSATGNRLAIGDSQDLALYHNGSNSFITDRGTGPLYIRGNNAVRIENWTGDASGEAMIIANSDGAVELYHNGTKKFETTSAGATVTGTLTATSFSGETVVGDTSPQLGGNLASNGNAIHIADNDRIYVGTGYDMEIFHDGSTSYIRGGSANIDIRAVDGEQSIVAKAHNAVELYYDGSKKFETLSDGVNVTGTLKVNGSAFSTSGGFLSSQQFTSSGTWTRPSGVTMIRVYVTGGGGGAGGGGSGGIDFGAAGGAGGTAIEILDVSSVSSATITIGAAGSGGAGSSDGSTGGTSSFGSYCSATGGGGGKQGNFGANKGGTGGVGSGGNINITGGDGGPGQDNSGISTQYATAFGVGGASYWGGGGGGSSHSGSPETGKAYGSGGGAAHSDNFNTGAAGKPGFIYVEQYS